MEDQAEGELRSAMASLISATTSRQRCSLLLWCGTGYLAVGFPIPARWQFGQFWVLALLDFLNSLGLLGAVSTPSGSLSAISAF
jgi:hypothetical protein